MSSGVATPGKVGPEILEYLDWLIGRAEGQEGRAALGPIAETVSVHYRALAICLFADDANVDEFFHWLLHSPLTRKHYLVTVQSKGLGEPRYGRASFVDPVLDALAARQWNLAAEITAMASHVWLEGEEYEDDFCYGEFLGCTVRKTSPATVLAQWRKALDGGSDDRLNVAEALVAKDPQEFEQALRALLRSNEAKAHAMADPKTPSSSTDDYTFAPNRWVSIEGLALLALADREGVPTEYDLEGCAASLRTEAYAPFLSRAYPHLGLR